MKLLSSVFSPLSSSSFFLPELIAAIVVVFILAILYEGLKTLRELLILRDLKHSKSHTESSTNSQKAALIVNNPAKKGWATLFWFNNVACMHVDRHAHVLACSISCS